MSTTEKKPASLRDFFEQSGIKQNFMANKWGISGTHLSGVINGRVHPSPELARKMSRDTGIPLENLLFPEDQNGS